MTTLILDLPDNLKHIEGSDWNNKKCKFTDKLIINLHELTDEELISGVIKNNHIKLNGSLSGRYEDEIWVYRDVSFDKNNQIYKNFMIDKEILNMQKKLETGFDIFIQKNKDNINNKIKLLEQKLDKASKKYPVEITNEDIKKNNFSSFFDHRQLGDLKVCLKEDKNYSVFKLVLDHYKIDSDKLFVTYEIFDILYQFLTTGSVTIPDYKTHKELYDLTLINTYITTPYIKFLILQESVDNLLNLLNKDNMYNMFSSINCVLEEYLEK